MNAIFWRIKKTNELLKPIKVKDFSAIVALALEHWQNAFSRMEETKRNRARED